MTDSGFTFHRNGEISLDWRGDTYWLHGPTVDEWTEIEAFVEELKEGLTDHDREMRDLTERIMQAKAEGDTETEKQLTEDRSGKLEAALESIVERARQRNIKTLQKIVETVGSDNWPDNPGEWPAVCLSMVVADQIRSHWLTHLPLASSAPPNGAQTPSQSLKQAFGPTPST